MARIEIIYIFIKICIITFETPFISCNLVMQDLIHLRFVNLFSLILPG